MGYATLKESWRFNENLYNDQGHVDGSQHHRPLDVECISISLGKQSCVKIALGSPRESGRAKPHCCGGPVFCATHQSEQLCIELSRNDFTIEMKVTGYGCTQL